MLKTAPLLLAVLSSAAAAQYKCVDKNGAVSFQQHACAAQAQQQKIDVRPAAPATVEAKTDSADQRLARDLERDRRVRELQFEITQTQDGILRRNQQMSNELDALRAKKGMARNNLAGATWEQSISDEMQAVTQRYKPMNDVDMDRIVQLRGELAQRQGGR